MEIKVIDEHHEAFLVWEKAVRKRKIKRGETLLQLDFHSDLVITKFGQSIHSRDIWRITQDQLNIGNFLIPAILRGTFNEVIILKPFGEHEKRRKLTIGSLEGKGLIIMQNFDKNLIKLFPDAKNYFLTQTSNISNIPRKEVVLDIDMDYFSCNLIQQQQFKLKLTPEQLKRVNRFSKSNDDHKINLGLFNIENNIMKFSPRNLHSNIIYNDSIEWIDYSIKSFVRGIKVRPKMISICRSVKSGFTPDKYADYIENTLIRYLNTPPPKIELPVISKLKIYPFIASSNNIIFNGFTFELFELKETSLFIWNKIKEGKDLNRILKEYMNKYKIDQKKARNEIIDIILKLKKNFIIECT